MHCPSCDFENPTGMKFCGACAAPLPARCPACGFDNPPQFKCGAVRSPRRGAGHSLLPQALALAEELGMRPLVAHCHHGRGMLYAATGQREQARTALSAAIALYRAMDMTFWVPQVEAALAQVGG